MNIFGELFPFPKADEFYNKETNAFYDVNTLEFTRSAKFGGEPMNTEINANISRDLFFKIVSKVFPNIDTTKSYSLESLKDKIEEKNKQLEQNIEVDYYPAGEFDEYIRIDIYPEGTDNIFFREMSIKYHTEDNEFEFFIRYAKERIKEKYRLINSIFDLLEEEE